MTGDPYGDGWLDAHDERADWGWLHGITDPDRPAPFVHCAEHGPFPFSRTECPQCATEAGLSWARYRYIERVRRNDMTSPNLTCETCYFWLHQPAVWADRGLCRVHAPTVTPQATGRIAEARWPHTERTDWCGEYKGAGS